jgi:hypothetical protein
MNRHTTNALLSFIAFIQGCDFQATNTQLPIVNSPPAEDTQSIFDNQEIGRDIPDANHDGACANTQERYKALVNEVKPGMSKGQVEAILGTADESNEQDMGDLNPQKAGQILDICTWQGDTESQSSIILSFVNGRLQDGGTPGYDIRKGFLSR